MKVFSFKLERILSLRKHREREKEIHLAGITGECVKLKREIEDRSFRKAGALVESRSGGAGTYSAEEFQMYQRYMSRLDQESVKKAEELAEREIAREAAQAEFLAASRDRKVLDKLKEKRSELYLKEQRVEETKQIDDINTGRAARGYSPSPSAMTESDNG